MNFLHRIVPFSSKRVSLANGYRYCVGSRVLHTERPEVLSDWQYCNMISSELKKNNTDSALQLLLQVRTVVPRATSATLSWTDRSTTRSTASSTK